METVCALKPVVTAGWFGYPAGHENRRPVPVFLVGSVMRLVAPLVALGLAATLGLSDAQAAPVNYTATHTYGNGPTDTDPGGTDPLSLNYVTVIDNSAVRFSDSFDFSSVAYTTISSITLTLDYYRAGPGLIPLELWNVRILGSNNASATDDQFGLLADLFAPTSYVLTAATDSFLGRSAFANALSTEALTFWFSEFTDQIGGADAFRLRSARIDIVGDLVPVPLPATGLLLIAGLGGLAALRRRRSR